MASWVGDQDQVNSAKNAKTTPDITSRFFWGFRQFDGLSGISGAEIMAQKPIFWQK